MESSQSVRQYIKTKEKLVYRAYPDPKTGGAPWTAGYGSTGHGIGPGTILTEQQAEDYFDADIAAAESAFGPSVTVPLTQGQYDALTSIVYNVGPGSPQRDGIVRLRNGSPSTLLKKLNAGDYQGAGLEFLKWDSPGSNVQHGLDLRRAEEVDLFWNKK